MNVPNMPDITAPLMFSDVAAEIMSEIKTSDAQRQAIEDRRSILRNRNRVLMILVAWIASLTIPIVANTVLHSAAIASYGASVGFTGDLMVTGYAWLRKY